MADSQDLIPKEFRMFKNECDADFVDAEDLSPQYLKQTLNLSPFRQSGSLVQVDGTSIKIAQADLPAVSGFVPIMKKWISFDKDSKEVLIVVYENSGTGEIKYFVNKYFNPVAYGVSQNNNMPLQNKGWIDGWLELTEKYTATMSANTAPNKIVFAAATFSQTSDYFNSFFVVNQNPARGNRYNYITDWDNATQTFTLKARVTGAPLAAGEAWVAADIVTIVRFPVAWLYNQPVNLPDEAVTLFDGKATDFIYIDNALRIPCGKYKQPLILQFIEKRSWFMGDDDMQYEGLWFDFQCPPQVTKDSAVTFCSLTGGSAATKYLNNNAGVWEWANSNAGATASVLFTFVSGNNYNIIFKDFTGTSPVYGESYEFSWQQIYTDIWIQRPLFGYFGVPYIRYWVKRGVIFSAAQIATKTNNPPLYPYPFAVTVSTAGNFAAVPTNLSLQNLFTNTWSTNAEEFGRNPTATNRFIGASVTVTNLQSDSTWIGVERYKFILNVVYDNRSELRLAHGAHRPKGSGDTSTATGSGLKIYFTLWFSRRLTGLSLFNQKHDKFAVDFSAGSYPGFGRELTDYPYFQYIDGLVNSVNMRSEETKHFARYSLADFLRVDKGSIAPFKQRPSMFDKTNGTNAFTYVSNEGRWYVVCNDTNCGWANDGEGLSHVAKTKRFLTQDTTMSYEKGVFIGDTNGRLFIINATNTIENEPLDNSDNTYFNVYAGLTSQYDVFLRNKYLSVASKDGDRIKRIAVNRSSILFIKDMNVYALNTRVTDDTKYFINDTYLGRGGYNCFTTPRGTVILSDDNIWMISDDSMEPLITPTNGRLSLYRATIALNTTNSFIEYNKTRDELYVFMNDVIFIYSFAHEAWTHCVMVEDAFCKYSGMNKAGEITFINRSGSNYNIVKLDSASANWIDAEGFPFPISWTAQWHKLPLAGRENDFNPQFITVNYSATCATNTNGLGVIVNAYDVDKTSSKHEKLRNGTEVRGEFPLEPLGDCSQCDIVLNSNIATSAITIQSVILWISQTKRKLGAYQQS